MKIQKILVDVSKRITPSSEEQAKINKVLSEFSSKLNKQLRKKRVKVFIGGSLAKKTLVKRDKGYDIDIFILFPYKMSSQSHKLADILEKILKKAKIKTIRLHGSRDYFQCKFKGLSIELIPILEIKKPSQALNITDISPLHVTYILKQIKKKKKLADEIRLAKAFCYGSECYGAESYIRGFSGYVLEVLICYYGSFLNFVKKASKWKLPTKKENKIIIDSEKYYKNKKQVFSELNEAKLHSPIILIDPVQKERNASAALSYKTFSKFIKACKDFLKNPSERFFFKEKFDIESWKKKASKTKAKFVIVKAVSTKQKLDIAGAKLKKFYEFLFFLLKKQGFKVIKGEFDFSEQTLNAVFYFIVEEPEKYYLVGGPPLKIDKKYIKAFKKKWKGAFVKKGRLWVKTKREISSVKELAKLISKNQLKEMGIKQIKIE